jgi:hypothetical protein
VKVTPFRVISAAVPLISIACPVPPEVNELPEMRAALAGEEAVTFVSVNDELVIVEAFFVKVGHEMNVILLNAVPVFWRVTVAPMTDVPEKSSVAFVAEDASNSHR